MGFNSCQVKVHYVCDISVRNRSFLVFVYLKKNNDELFAEVLHPVLLYLGKGHKVKKNHPFNKNPKSNYLRQDCYFCDETKETWKKAWRNIFIQLMCQHHWMFRQELQQDRNLEAEAEAETTGVASYWFVPYELLSMLSYRTQEPPVHVQHHPQ